jgi:NADH-quinone oxidoreductase subunit D
VRLSIAIPIGPYHLALKESSYFRLEVDGERIVNADMKVGYMHRGIEWLATKKTYHQNIFLCERICGICSDAHSTAYCQTVEDLLGIEVPPRARYLRMIVAELERLHSHFLWFGVAMHLIGFDTAFMHIWKDREAVMRLIESITGKRVNYGFNTLGGTRRDITREKARSILKDLAAIEKAADRIKEIVAKDRLVKRRVQEVGYLSAHDARRLCVVGPTARASSILLDVRKDDPYLAYDELEWKVPVSDEGDVLARIQVRLMELYESIRIVKQALESLPTGPTVSDNWHGEFPVSQAFGRVEAPRGELFYYIRSNGTNVPERVRIRTPSVMNNAALSLMLIGYSISDAPLIIASIDPCFACTDRVAIVDVRKKGTKYVTLDELARKR